MYVYTIRCVIRLQTLLNTSVLILHQAVKNQVFRCLQSESRAIEIKTLTRNNINENRHLHLETIYYLFLRYIYIYENIIIILFLYIVGSSNFKNNIFRKHINQLARYERIRIVHEYVYFLNFQYDQENIPTMENNRNRQYYALIFVFFSSIIRRIYRSV